MITQPPARRASRGQSRLGPLLAAALLAMACTSQSPKAGAKEAHSCQELDHQHQAWQTVLDSYVKDGWVDYARLKKQGRHQLQAYLDALASVCKDNYQKWSKAQKLAYWINAYNAFTIDLILDNYPLDSIRSIGFLPGAAFRREFIPLGHLRGDTMSLNDIEHEILRKEFREPRIHFAVVCASKSCPILRSEAYVASKLDAQLEDAARGFLRDRSRNRYDGSENELQLSSIFKWFREDFEKGKGDLVSFVARYLPEADAQRVKDSNPDVEFLDYDWSLNGR